MDRQDFRFLGAATSLLGRLGLALIFVDEGWSTLGTYGATQDYMAGHGVSPGLLPLVIATELGCGLLVAAGLLTRWAAVALSGFCLLTALIFHRELGDPAQWINFYKNIAMSGGFLTLAAHGAGPWSLDAALRQRDAADPITNR